MGKRIGMEVAMAVAEAVGLCDIDMAAVYPITPQSHIAEHLSDLVANGEIHAEFVTVESEHSAMSAVIGASGTGARSFTATSSQGLMLMHELLPIASAMRLPIVMAIANRAVSGPLNILMIIPTSCRNAIRAGFPFLWKTGRKRLICPSSLSKLPSTKMSCCRSMSISTVFN